jgi:branched-chain amino acid transport system substrate-binding protein/urea transport system substrate-binding protein
VGIAATRIPVIAFSVGEEELKGIDTKPLVGHLAAWSYFQSIVTPQNRAFVDQWHSYTKDPHRVTNDPMESDYLLFNMWAQAVKKAGSTEVEAVREAMIGQTVVSPTGLEVVMNANHHLTKPVLIGEIRANGQFKIVYQGKPIAPNPWSPYLPGNKKMKVTASK